MSRRLIYKDVLKAFIKHGWVLVETNYINNSTPMKCICPNNHETTKTWNNFSKDRGCKYCANRNKVDINKAKILFNKYNWKVLSKECVDGRDKLECICDKGHALSMCYNQFQQGNRCKKCYDLRRKGKTHYNYKGGISGKNIALYNTYAQLLTPYQKVYKSVLVLNKKEIEVLQVNCHYCTKKFTPKLKDIQSRLEVINGKRKGAAHLYCSDQCKKDCSTYGQIVYPKGQKTSNTRTHQTEWANLVKANANHICEICNNKNTRLIGHHEVPIVVDEILSLDIDNGLCLCEDCHKKVHQLPWCRLSYLRNCGINKKKMEITNER